MGTTGDGLRLAVGTLTIIPAGDVHPVRRETARVAMIAAPLAVVPIAAVAGIVLWLAMLVGVPPLVAAALALASLAVLTRAMHLDGLADTVDGLGGGWTRERALEIMRTGDVGPMGTAALVLLVLVQAGSLATIAVLPWAGLLVAAAVCASRLAATLACTSPVPAARDSGMGAVMARAVPPSATAVGSALAAGLLVAGAAASGIAWWWGLAAAGCLVVAVGILLAMIVRKIGGITGDVIGAGIEVGFAACLVVLAIGAAA